MRWLIAIAIVLICSAQTTPRPVPHETLPGSDGVPHIMPDGIKEYVWTLQYYGECRSDGLTAYCSDGSKWLRPRGLDLFIKDDINSPPEKLPATQPYIFPKQED